MAFDKEVLAFGVRCADKAIEAERATNTVRQVPWPVINAVELARGFVASDNGKPVVGFDTEQGIFVNTLGEFTWCVRAAYALVWILRGKSDKETIRWIAGCVRNENGEACEETQREAAKLIDKLVAV